MGLFTGIATGVLAGVAWGITGFIAEKSKKGSDEGFEPWKFGRAILSGVVVGGFIGASGSELSPANFESYAVAYPVTAVIDVAIKFLERLLKRAK